MTDRTLPILYSSPVHTPPEQEQVLEQFLRQNISSRLGVYTVNGNVLWPIRKRKG